LRKPEVQGHLQGHHHHQHTYIQRIRTDHHVQWYELFHYTQAMLPHPPTTETFVQEGHSSMLMLERKQLRQFAVPYPHTKNFAQEFLRPFQIQTHNSEILVAVTYAE
jgi:hypothetical protein